MASKKARGKRAKTRHSHAKKGSKTTVNKLLQDFELNSRVLIRVDGSIHRGTPFRRFNGKIGTVVEKRGRSFLVNFYDGNLAKQAVVGSAHLHPIKQ